MSAGGDRKDSEQTHLNSRECLTRLDLTRPHILTLLSGHVMEGKGFTLETGEGACFG